MKITNPDGLQQLHQESTQPLKKSPGDSDFNRALQKAMAFPDAKNAVKHSTGLSEPRAVSGIGKPTLQTSYINKTTRVISLLDQYTKSLSNPEKTLKDIEPELMQFIDEAETLHEDYLKTTNPDTGLKTIMDDLLRAARLESIRFQRGDYLDSD
jgi:hypothetical protein